LNKIINQNNNEKTALSKFLSSLNTKIENLESEIKKGFQGLLPSDEIVEIALENTTFRGK